MIKREKKYFTRRRTTKDESVMMIKTPKSRGSWRLWVLAFVLLLLIGGSVYLLFFSDYFKVKEVYVEGAKENMEEDIRNMVTWETEYMILFDERTFAESVKTNWDELAWVEVAKDWPTKINVYLGYEEPKIVWNSGGRLYLLNDSGVVLRSIEEEERLEKYIQLPVVGDLSSLPVEENDKLVSSDFVDFVYKVKEYIDQSIKKPVEAYEIEETTFELRVRFAEGFLVYFDTLRDPMTQVEKLNIFLQEGTRIDEYIDLRVPGKVYYK